MLATSLIRRAEEAAPVGARSLRELLVRGERPDRATLVDWGCQLLEILAGAHAQGVLHRHLTEDEVIVTPEGRLVLNGFGRRRLGFDPRLPPPPEQLAGKPYTVRSDLYAVGSLLRRLAFAGALHEGRGSLGRRDPLLKVLARATFNDPAGRYESAAEMAEALREAGRPEVVTRFRQRTAANDSNARVTAFPGASLRLLPVPPAASAPRPQSSEDNEPWRVLLLLVLSLLLMTFVLATGWFLLGRNGSSWPVSEPAAHFWTPPATPESPGAVPRTVPRP